jgi:hypothetical protein
MFGYVRLSGKLAATRQGINPGLSWFSVLGIELPFSGMLVMSGFLSLISAGKFNCRSPATGER